MKETGAELAGEMSGHIFFKERWFGFDDGLYSAARMLEIVSQYKEPCSTIFDSLPDSVNTPELQILFDENINIENGYGFVIESRKNAVFVIDVNDIDRAKDLIEASGFKTLTPQQLSEIEPFHYLGY